MSDKNERSDDEDAVMLPVAGWSQPAILSEQIAFVRDLVYFRGTVIAEFSNRQGDPYVYHWVDSDDEHNRWLLYRVTGLDMRRLKLRKVTLYDLIVNAPDGFVYIVDTDHKQRRVAARMCSPATLPDSYLPEPEALLPDLSEDEESAQEEQGGDFYAALTTDSFEVGDVGEVQSALSGLYLLTAAYDRRRVHGEKLWSNLAGIKFPPMRGAFSEVHLLRDIQDVLPSADALKQKAIQVSSPGFLEWTLNSEVMDLLRGQVDMYMRDRLRIRHAADELKSFIRVMKLNKMEDVEAIPHEDQSVLEKLLKSLSVQLHWINHDLMRSVHPQVWYRAKINLLLVRRLERLAKYTSQQKIEL